MNRSPIPQRFLALILLITAITLAACQPQTDFAPDSLIEGNPAEGGGDTAVAANDTDSTTADATAATPTVAIDTNTLTTDDKGLQVGFTADGYPFRGNPDAPVVMEEFSDYECPFCSRFVLQTLPTIEQNQIERGEVLLVFYDFPLTTIHPHAMTAHNAAHCAGDQGAAAYWNMHDLLFENLNEWSNNRVETVLIGFAESLELDMDAFTACLEDETHVDRIEANIDLGFSRGVSSTPSFFINEEPLIGAHPLDIFNQVISNALSGQPIVEAQPTAVPGAPVPTPTPADIDLTLQAASLGDPNAPVQIIEFSDYQCPYCQRHSLQTLPTLITEMVETGQVHYIYMDFPLDSIHPEARGAAAAARCASDQDAYWEMHDALFTSVESWAGQGAAAANVYASLAADLGLDIDAFTACVESGKYDTAVDASYQEAIANGVQSTPSFFINGYPMSGAQPIDVFYQVIELAQQNELGNVIAQQMQRAQEEAQQQPEPQPQENPEPVDVPLGDAYAIGDPDAPVVIVEYTDFQCPYCQRHATQTYPTIVEEYIDQGLVYYVFKDFPLTSIHPQAVLAHQAARCAQEQDAFLAMHEALFAQQDTWSGSGSAADIFQTMATDLGMNGDAFATCLDSGKYEEAVLADLDEGISLGVSGTPSFFINGYFISGAQPIDLFASAVEYFSTNPE